MWDRLLKDSIDSGHTTGRGYLFSIRKNCVAHMHGLAVYVQGELPLAQDLSLENSEDYLYFRQTLFYQMFYHFFLYRSPSSLMCSVFDAISSSIDQVISINSSANLFVFGHFNVYYKDRLTSFSRTDQPSEICYNFPSHLTLLCWLTFLSRSLIVTLTVLFF